MHKREGECNIIVGTTGTGKSTFTARVVDALPWHNALIYKKHFNIDDKAFLKYPLQRIRDYRGGKVRISDMDIKYKPFLKLVTEHFRNGAVVIDDASIYERDDTSDELNTLIAMRRHIGVDVFMIYHGLTMLPIRQFPYVNHLVLFKTADNFGYKAKKLPEFEKLELLRQRVALDVERGNRFANRIIKLS